VGSQTLVEFHGRQHYEAVKGWGGVKAFKSGQRRDRFKARWAAKNAYRLITIKYDQNVEEVLTCELGITIKRAA
jgi:hypothetical protein